jgi:hypothetical protein
MKKNWPYLLFFVLLALVTSVLIFKDDFKSEDEKSFAITDTKEIYGFKIVDKMGNEVYLKKTENGWTINGFPAEKSLVVNVLETINKLQVNVPVSEDLRKKVIERLRNDSKKITFYNKDQEEIKSIHIAGSHIDMGNYMILEKNGTVSPNPYIVQYPTFKGDLSYRFPIDSIAWKSTEVIACKVDYIQKIEVKYFEKPEMSFTLDKDENAIKISPYNKALTIQKPLNKEKIVNFLLPFEKLHFEAWILEDSVKNKIKSRPLYASVKLTDIEQGAQEILLYKIPVGDDYKIKDVAGKSLPFNVERFWGYIPKTKSYVLVQYYVFGPILREYAFFFE